MKARVAVIGGGQNCEHEVSLASAAAVAAALAALTAPGMTAAADCGLSPLPYAS